MYYAGLSDDYPVLCKFKNVSPGDTITCSSTPYDTFRVSTFIVIEYDHDCTSDSDESGRRRLFSSTYHFDDDHQDEDSSIDSVDPESSSGDSHYIESLDIDTDTEHSDESVDSDDRGTECIAKLRTDCRRNLVGTQSEGCGVLTVTAFVDGEGMECDAADVVIVDDGSSSVDSTDPDDGATGYNALSNGEENMSAPLRWIEELDPFIKWALLCIFVSSMALMLCSCYFCIFRNRARAQKRPSAAAKERLRTLSYGNLAVDEEEEEDFFSENGQTQHRIGDTEEDEDNDSEIEMITVDAGE